MRVLLWVALGGLLLAGIAAMLFSGVFILGARTAVEEPPGFIISAADMGKGFMVPGDYQRRTNPVAASPEVLANARRVYTARCVVCHGTDGKGATTIGSRTYPRAADLTAARTQGKADGALFWFIEMGIPHTGMPGWKDAISEQEIWQLVTYIRELPKGVPAEAAAPTTAPTAVVAAAAPTSAPPTTAPTAVVAAAAPTSAPPTTAPTVAPTAAPTRAPTSAPTAAPTATSAPQPTVPPTAAPAPPTATPPAPTAAPKAAPPAAAAPAPVKIIDYTYDPQQITVSPGTRVVWTNLDDDVHTVTAEGNANLFDSGEIAQNAIFAFTFDQPGEYAYYCVPHDYMKGKIVVR